jgi:hypothetical protein
MAPVNIKITAAIESFLITFFPPSDLLCGIQEHRNRIKEVKQKDFMFPPFPFFQCGFSRRIWKKSLLYPPRCSFPHSVK